MTVGSSELGGPTTRDCRALPEAAGGSDVPEPDPNQARAGGMNAFSCSGANGSAWGSDTSGSSSSPETADSPDSPNSSGTADTTGTRESADSTGQGQDRAGDRDEVDTQATPAEA